MDIIEIICRLYSVSYRLFDRSNGHYRFYHDDTMDELFDYWPSTQTFKNCKTGKYIYNVDEPFFNELVWRTLYGK
jgi:hypothetical protein